MPDTPLHLLVAALGGTIASTADGSGGVAPALSGAEIAAAAGLDRIWPDLQADFTQVAQVSSANVTLDMLHDVVDLAVSHKALDKRHIDHACRFPPSPANCADLLGVDLKESL